MAKKSWWQKFIEKLAAASEKEYGNDIPDCCADGRTKKQSTQNHSHKQTY